MRARQAPFKKAAARRRLPEPAGYKFSVLFIEDPAGWSAQVLERDIATQADTLEDLFYEVERILFSHVALALSEGRVPFADLSPAPAAFWELFKKSYISMRGPNAGLKQQASSPPKIRQDIRIARHNAA